ncbi:DEAD/DEAH box helicase [Pikeienuella piscinae]|uniref:DEAD-box ATP-dependent RNA helicase RhpA n=1 Tax=Pikeienuella piscinae TaxID=2748098 RepID=A0A7M3T6X0_9RHOB|nr:DEAD/DEAH box helicase [Pikeienuella piscinae]
MTFQELGFAEPILRALKSRDYEIPTPIQAQAIPALMQGRDMIGIAQTGTGKTAAFALPILHALASKTPQRGARGPRALILAPTRELAIQIGEEMRSYAQHLRLFQTVIFGGVGHGNQIKALSRGVDIVIATPGRLLDHIQSRHVSLGAVEHLVLDEADRMLDMGFVHDVRRIVGGTPKARQTLLFSATMEGEVARLAAEFLTEPARVEVTPQATPVDRIAQTVRHMDGKAKNDVLLDLLADRSLDKVILFTRTKHRANKVAETLEKSGVVADAIHGGKSQNARQRAIKRFSAGSVRVLVATDIAARGIDIGGVTHVVNYDLPNEPESYVHRIGRTARAGAEGEAVSFCDASERGYLRAIERLIGVKLALVGEGPKGPDEAPPSRGGGNRGGGRPHGQARKSNGAPRQRRADEGSKGKPRRNRNWRSGKASANA